MKRGVSRWVPLVLAVVGPTLIVPIGAWHHHDDPGDHLSCALCAAAVMAVGNTPTSPPVVFAFLAVRAVPPVQIAIASHNLPKPIARGPPAPATCV